MCLGGLLTTKTSPLTLDSLQKSLSNFVFFKTHPQNKTKQNITKTKQNNKNFPHSTALHTTLTPPDFPDSIQSPHLMMTEDGRERRYW
jgi:hypothetical protein